jgi:uncharacterized damage-inducible protein DinB
MACSLPHSIEILERTPGILRAMLGGLGAHWTHSNYGEDTFSPFDVVGHLIHGEKADWIARARIILNPGPARPFDPYDRYAQFEESRGKSLDQLLDEFQRSRAENLKALRGFSLTPEQLMLRGTHPALGSVTLGNLLATWVAHDMNHVAQIARCIAAQYAEAVGPWREYLGVLKSPVTRMDSEGSRRHRAAMSGEAAEA